MKPIPLHRHTETIRGSNMKVNYKGYVIRATNSGRLLVLSPPPDCGPIGDAPTLGAAKRLVDQQFQYEGPPAA